MPEPKKRTRTPLGVPARPEGPSAGSPPPKAPLPPHNTDSIAAPIPVTTWAETPPSPHFIIQGFAGPYRGVLAQIGEIHGPIYKCYLILPQNRRESFEIKASDCVVIGKSRVHARNPFAVTPVQHPGTVPPIAQPTFDDPTSEI